MKLTELQAKDMEDYLLLISEEEYEYALCFDFWQGNVTKLIKGPGWYPTIKGITGKRLMLRPPHEKKTEKTPFYPFSESAIQQAIVDQGYSISTKFSPKKNAWKVKAKKSNGTRITFKASDNILRIALMDVFFMVAGEEGLDGPGDTCW